MSSIFYTIETLDKPAVRFSIRHSQGQHSQLVPINDKLVEIGEAFRVLERRGYPREMIMLYLELELGLYIGRRP